MSLKYISRFQFNDDLAEDDIDGGDLAVEVGTLQSQNDPLYGTVLFLDGTTSLMSAGDFTVISGDQDRSFSFWAKNDVSSIENPILSYGDLSDVGFVIYTTNPTDNPEINDLTTPYISSETTVISTWNYYTITYTSGNMLLYIDSVLTDTFSTTLDTGTGDSLRIGTDGIGGYFTGNVSDMRIYDNVLDSQTIQYIYSVGPNFEEKVDANFIENVENFGLGVSGTVMSRSEYSVQETGEKLRNSFFITDNLSSIREAARVEYEQDGSASMSIKTRHTENGGDNVLYESVNLKSESSTFTNVDDSDVSSSIIFSSNGVNITSDIPGLFFGAGKDFRMSVSGDFFTIEALDTNGSYVKKMEVGK